MVVASKNQKKRKVTSQDKLSEELQALFTELYPSYHDIERNLIRIDKPDGTFICCVPLETEDTSYLVKIKVVVDKNPEESYEKEDDYPGENEGEDMQGADELADSEDEPVDD